ncbi:alpha/beta hydrolase [Undibacterium terreum]|uniref:Esterase n=1 Tax=Undibacterium terreum TaxID=1224302 RepID=A0A916UIV1_9BURK|nr:alpha/beta hydrolase [Undibacterium terreum]GGC72530.1 esterase [Undibacterium terreum]
MQNPSEYYSQQYNARASIPDHPYIFTRWVNQSTLVRRTNAGLFDLMYGEKLEERLDIFPARTGGGPLLVFIHGGWWRSLDKFDFSMIAPGFTSAGINVALTNYTLAPGADIEEIVQQQLRAVAWLYRNVEKYDIDPQRIVIAGHSAGAHLAAMMMAAQWPTYADDLPPDLIKAGVLTSGLYDLTPVPHAEFVNVDLKLTQERALALSPGFMPQSHATPFITAVGGLESDEFKRQNSLIASAWKSQHRTDIPLPEANHLTICDALTDRESPLFKAMLELVAGV